jgi:cytochrome P450
MQTDVPQIPARLPPGPPLRRGLLGSLGYYYGFYNDPIGFVRGRFDTYGDIYYAPSDSGGLYVIRHPDHLREVLVTRAAAYTKDHTGLRLIARFLGEGLLTSDGEAWKRQRRMIQPAFSAARIAEYARIMAGETDSLAARLKDGGAIDASREMMELTLRIVSRALFGHDVSTEIEEVARAMAVFQTSVAVPDVFPRWMPNPYRTKLHRAIATIDRIIHGMIEDRRRGGPRADGRTDLLQMLVTAVDEEGDKKGLTEREVRDQLVTLFLAGHETTSHALTWTLYLLSQNPAVEADLHREIEGALGGHEPTPDDLPRLPLSERVINEAMRLYPPAFTVARRAQEDTEIGGYPVPRGSEVMLWIYMTHHDSRWYPEPEAFRPDRFLPEEEAKRPKLAYLPFGAGPRICIGKAFAMLEARLILTSLIGRFHFTLEPNQRVEPVPRITLGPKGGVRMRVQQRARS